MDISLPKNVLFIMERLKTAGYEAYCVGGAVRDCIMGTTPEDWDITTNALPEKTREIFADLKTVDTGLKHGTLGIVKDRILYEVTTYRVDGGYTDNRHPDKVTFTPDLKNDLARRDFTMNAIAYNPEFGTVDYYGGKNDIYNSIIRTVGEPQKRFCEDGLRIMRALRFSAVLGFSIEEKTALAIHENKDLLKNISTERLSSELTKLVCGKNAFEVLTNYHDILAVIIPEIAFAVGFKQYGEKHAYDVWEHICRTVAGVPSDRVLRLTMLLHDLGKVPTHKLNEKGESTFKNHAKVGGDMAKNVLTRLKFDKKTIDRVSFLVANHDFEPPQTKTELKKHLKTKTPEDIKTLLVIKKSDRAALSENYRDISVSTEICLKNLKEIIDNNECCTVSQLAVNGKDLQTNGLKGKAVGDALNILLDAVIEGKVENTKQALLTYPL